MPNYSLANVTFTGRTELHDLLKLSGSEISINTLQAGMAVPFVHRHNQNEEVYLILDGSGLLYIDGEEKHIHKGDCFRIDPAGARGLTAGKNSSLCYICIQTKVGSLEHYTMTDGVLTDDKPSWLK